MKGGMRGAKEMDVKGDGNVGGGIRSAALHMPPRGFLQYLAGISRIVKISHLLYFVINQHLQFIKKRNVNNMRLMYRRVFKIYYSKSNSTKDFKCTRNVLTFMHTLVGSSIHKTIKRKDVKIVIGFVKIVFFYSKLS